MNLADNIVSQHEAERIARREQAKAMRALFVRIGRWLARRPISGSATASAAH